MNSKNPSVSSMKPGVFISYTQNQPFVIVIVLVNYSGFIKEVRKLVCIIRPFDRQRGCVRTIRRAIARLSTENIGDARENQLPISFRANSCNSWATPPLHQSVFYYG